MIYLWVKANKLSLNIDKTYFMLFTPKTFPRNMDNITIHVDGKPIMEVHETKFLGVIIDNDLNWKPHTTYISKKLLKALTLYWRQERYSIMRLYPHSILHLYTHIWILVSKSGVELTLLIWRISLYYKIRLFALSTEFRRELTLNICIFSRVFWLWNAFTTTI